jgi:hypothetical protein
LLLDDNGRAPAAATSVPPPDCPEHPGSRVARAGTYGKQRLRQRYLCRPDGGKPHQFTPPLSREAVSPGETCVRCDELLSPHHGPITAARHTPWTLVAVVQALNDLSLGASYASVGVALRAQRELARQHLSHDHGIEGVFRRDDGSSTAARDFTARDRKNAWRLAADLVEQYSPLLYDDVAARHVADAQALRAANDAALTAAPDKPLETPLVYVIDEHPIWAGTRRGKRPAWSVLTVVEVRWVEGRDPFAHPQRSTRLRLARALPSADGDAWQLVLDELEVRPDFVVADAGSGLQRALRSHYGSSVGVVPSLWHIHANLRDALVELPNTTFLDGEEKVLVDPLRKQLAELTKEQMIKRRPQEHATWWDELEAIVQSLPAPVAKIRTLRARHEPRLVAALPILAGNPGIPASNGAVENQIRVLLHPFLENRANLFGNLERTNRLLNLLVARHDGAFDDLDALALRIRRSNEAAGGWAPAPRQILDRQPQAGEGPRLLYRSLRSPAVVSKIARDRGLTTASTAMLAAPPPLLSKQKPQTVALLAIRDWARSLGLTVGATGPIPAATKAAYDARQNGATDDEALEVYRNVEAARAQKNLRSKKQRWTSSAQQQRAAELAPIRQWAKAHGYDVAPHARIPAPVMEAFEAAQRGELDQLRPSRRPPKATR